MANYYHSVFQAITIHKAPRKTLREIFLIGIFTN